MDNNNDGMNTGGQGVAPVNDAPVDGGVADASVVQPSEPAPAPVAEPAPTPAPEPVVSEPAAPAQETPAPAPIATPAPAPVSTPDPVSVAGNPPAPTAQKKSNSKMIILVAGIVVVLVAVIVTLVVVLINNNNKSSKSSGSKGSSYYEEDDDQDEIGGGWSDDDSGSTGSADTISCFGYQFEKRAGYEYACEGNALGVHNSTFGVYLEPVSGMSYYQAEGHVSELAANLSQQGTVRGYRSYTTSSGRKMLVFDMSIEGVNVYTFVTAASSSSVLVGMVVNESGSVSASDLEKADAILGGSTISSRLPDGEADEGGEIPTIDWNLKAPEL